MRPLLDATARGLARLLLHIFFRETEIVGAEHVPAGRPLVLVANHVNGMVDPLLLVVALPRLPRFLAKSTLWDIWALRPILALGGVVPVYRRQDPGVDPAQNLQTFAHSRAVLLAGGSIAIFPEGISHDLPALQPLKSGAARIALEAESEARAQGRALGVGIVPVGLAFEARESFRSRALVRIGAPLDLAPEIDSHGADPIAATEALTARIETALEAVTQNHETWDEARLVARGADLAALDHEPQALPHQRKLAQAHDLRRTVTAAARRLRPEHPERIAALTRAVRHYDRLLKVLGLRDEHLTATYATRAVLRVTAKTIGRLVLTLPAALLGTLLNCVPYCLVRVIAQRSREGNMTATLKLYPGLVLYPLFWVAAAWFVLRYTGSTGWASLTLLASPLTGWVALLFHERRERFLEEARIYFLLRRRGGLATELRSRRAAVQAEIRALAALLPAASP